MDSKVALKRRRVRVTILSIGEKSPWGGVHPCHFTLDDVGVLDQAERNPDSLLATRPVILDEVQRAPQILLAVKRAVDTLRRAGDFILAGSANLRLMKHVADTMAGRTIYLDLRPFCPTEWQERKDALLPLERLFAPDFDWRDGRMSRATARHGCCAEDSRPHCKSLPKQIAACGSPLMYKPIWSVICAS